jgi:hypothetical protein
MKSVSLTPNPRRVKSNASCRANAAIFSAFAHSVTAAAIM